jgi:hypothetical protein
MRTWILSGINVVSAMLLDATAFALRLLDYGTNKNLDPNQHLLKVAKSRN